MRPAEKIGIVTLALATAGAFATTRMLSVFRGGVGAWNYLNNQERLEMLQSMNLSPEYYNTPWEKLPSFVKDQLFPGMSGAIGKFRNARVHNAYCAHCKIPLVGQGDYCATCSHQNRITRKRGIRQ